jgi:hypothetical protein
VKGMDTIVALRRSGVKPECVFVYLVETIDIGCPALSPHGNATVEIAKHENLSDIDFRPLHGLYVLLCDVTGDARRYRRLGRLVAEANPSKLVMPIATADGYTVYRREGDITETIAL